MMIKLKHIFTFTLISISLSFVYGQDIKQNPNLIKERLSNGLTYYIYPNDYPKGEAVYRLFIKSGSANEEENQKGLAHFLEHMAFNGTKNFPGNELVKFLESKGAKFGQDLNAHTSYNETVYKLQLPSDRVGIVDTTLTILADWIDNISLDPAEIDNERGVIISEWLSKKSPKSQVSDVLLDKLLNGSRYSERKVIGDTAVIKNFSYQTLRDYYNEWYQPNLMAVAVTGDINPKTVERMIKEKFSGIHVEKRSFPETYSISPYNDKTGSVVINDALKEPELVLLQLIPKFPSVRTESEYLPYLTRTITNRLIRNRFNTLSFSNTDYSSGSVGISDFLNTSGVIMGSVKLIPDKVETGISTYLNQVEQIFQYGFLPLEIEKIKKSYINSLKRRAESKSPIASSVYMEEIYNDYFKDYTVTTASEEYRLALKYIDKIDSVSVANFLKEIYDKDKSNFLYSNFNSNEIADSIQLMSQINSAHLQAVTAYKQELDVPDELITKLPKRGKIKIRKTIKEIDGTELTLSNGVKVIYRQAVTSKDRVSISAFKKGGLYALDSADYVSGSFAGSVIALSGVGSLSRDELSHYLAGNSAAVNLLIDKTRAGAVGSAATEDVETLFQLLYLRMTQPRLDMKVFDQTKEMLIEKKQKENITDQTLFYEDLNYLMKGNDYVTRTLTEDVLRNQVQSEKMIPIFKKSFGNAHGFTYVVLSDSPLEFFIPYIEQYIASLPSNKKKATHPYKYSGGKILTEATDFVRKAGDSPKATVSLIFQQTDVPENLDEYKLQSEIASQIVRMKLLSKMREELGKVYSVSVSSGSTLNPSDLSRSTIAFSCDPEDVDLLIDAIKSTLKELVENPQSFEIELANVKKNQKKNMASNIQKDSFWSTFIRNAYFNEQYNWNYIYDFDAIVDGVSTFDLSEIINRNFYINSRIKAILLPKTNI